MLELLECNDFKSLTCTPSKHDQRQHTFTQQETTPTVSKPSPLKQSAPEQLAALVDSLDSLTDDFELMESLIDGNFNKTTEVNHKHIDDEFSEIDPFLINENDNLSLPENFNIEDDSPRSSIGNPYSTTNNNSIKKLEVESVKQQKTNIGKRIFSGIKKSCIPSKKNITTAPSSAKSINMNATSKNIRKIDQKNVKVHVLANNQSVSSYSTEKIVRLERQDSLAYSKKSPKPDASISLKNKKNMKYAEVQDDEQQSRGDWYNNNTDEVK